METISESDAMKNTAEREFLGCSKRGDAISIGWRAKDREPIIEFIKSPGTPLEVKMAFEVDGRSKKRHDYRSAKTTDCPDAHLGGGFMRLKCVEGGITAAELLRPVYDLCAWLPHPRIWYERYIWPEPMRSRGEYAIEEARAVLGHGQSKAIFGSREFAGVFYPSYAKVLGILEEFTTPGEEANDEITRMINFDSFCISTHPGRTDAGKNWELAQEKMAARVIWYMKNNPFANSGFDRWLDIVGPLEMPDGFHSIDELGKLDGADRFHLLVSVLSMLKGDDRLHLVRTGIPVELYLNGVITRHRPGDD